MSNFDYQEQLNARTAQHRDIEAQRAKLAEEAERKHQAAQVANARRAAFKEFTPKAIKAAVWWICLLTAALFDWVVAWLAVSVAVCVLVWATYWVGVTITQMEQKEGD